MDFGTIASIAGPVIGGMMGNKAAKYGAAAQMYAIDQQMRPYNLREPYYKRMFEGAEGALDDALNTGTYTGSTYAGMDPMASEGFNYIANFGRGAMGNASGFMGQGGGFGSNYQNIYSRAAGPTLDNAVNYATSSPQANSLIDAAMRDSTRRLNEQTLPGISQAASATNNTNSSRAGIAEGIAQRSYDDRRADVASNVFDRLSNQYLQSNTQDINNMMQANAGLQNTYGIGFGMGPTIGQMLTGSGGAFQTDRQGQLDADRDLFNRQRDFRMDQYSNFNNLLGGLGSPGQINPVTSNPYTATLGGAMAGFGVGNKLGDLFKQPTPTYSTGSVNPGTGYYHSYNPTSTIPVSSYY